MKKLLLLVVLCLPGISFAKTEIDELKHAQFRIDVPDNWNHSLVVYCHGYNPEPVKFEAGKPLCGTLTRATDLIEKAFDQRVLFDYYFPGLLPSPEKVPSDFKTSDALVKKVLARVNAKPEASRTLRKLVGIRKNEDLAG